MEDILFPYLTAMVVTAAALTVGAFSYWRFQSAARNHAQKAQRLPDFILWADLSQKVAEMQETYDALRQQEAAARAIVDEAEKARQFLAEHERAIKEAKDAVEQRDKAESELVTVQQNLANATEEFRKVDNECSKAKFELDQLQQMIAARTKDKGELDAERTRLRNAIEGLETQRRKDLEEAERLMKQNAALAADVAALEARKASLREEVTQLEDREGKARAAVRQLEGRVAELEPVVGPAVTSNVEERAAELREPVLDPGRLSEPASGLTEKEALQAVQDHLDAHELRFHPRVIKAFHTALKVQGDSPLLVLAGISGTGKSLLPQRYAEAIGIHPLVVPVQPRWDGPQDLLGFYHHLEGKFKATQLTRALLQFDPASDLAPEEARLRDRMLMIVLDEMNLARIEYYFSEFLSRLETRRDVDLATAHGRQQCSVPLEIGSVDGKDATIDLLVDRNVLFVGTINEDESTQTLSDKVVDRANVMRFGRPAKLARPAARDRRGGTAAENHLPRAVWESWQRDAKPLSEAEVSRVEKVSRSLNDALERVGKAFGHRTFRAMLSYVGQYPGEEPDRIDHALSDQIEQRILPKLRGFDPADESEGATIHGVRQVVEELKDTTLSEAIERGCQGHTFLWQGIERS